ncbi:hypothetical protein A8M77_23150 [Variovorax sp. JS1663]|nr:hypothetical protein A8M77_23150 [Variovorax sp. JS1663]
MPPILASAGVAAWLVLIDNVSFWRTFIGAQDGALLSKIALALSVALVLIAVLTTACRLIATPRAGVAVFALLLIVSAGVAHYLDRWGVLFDKGLIRNIVETDVREARELLSWPAFIDVALRGLLPAALLWWVGIRRSSAPNALLQTGGVALCAATLGASVIFLFYGDLATTFRNHRELRFQLVPTNYFNAVYGFLKGTDTKPRSLAAVGSDARRTRIDAPRPRVLVLVVDETARASNFSLGGYQRETNLALKGKEIVYFSNVSSCGTDTATSLPCMFSDLGMSRFSLDAGHARENLLDVLVRAGVTVTWLDNNSGCKGVCARVRTEQMPTSGDPKLCMDGSCQDEILVPALDQLLANVRDDSTIVLHKMGSHGPSYFRRYPAPGRFQPTCDTNRVQTCTREQLVNTYDNSIDYTSRVVAMVLDAARARAAELDIAVLYVSDHGESLGENNIYLHGLPRLLAPPEQTAIPMMAWLSAGASRSLPLRPQCLAAVSGKAFSHDNLFHTVLGYHAIDTSAYRPDLDIFSIARSIPGCEGNQDR